MAGLLTRSCVFAAALFVCACGDDDPGATSVPEHVLVRAAGDWQRGMGLETLREPITVRAIDPVTLEPIARLSVRFTVEPSSAGARLSDTVAVTNTEGIARTELTLGREGPDTVYVRARAGDGPAQRFTTLASPAPVIRDVRPLMGRGDFETIHSGETVAIIGERLLFAQGTGVVRFNGTPVRPISVSDTLVRVVPPACLASGTVEVTITNGGARTEPVDVDYAGGQASVSLAPLTGTVLPASRLAECFILDGAGAEYLVIAQVDSDSPGPEVVDVELTANDATSRLAIGASAPFAKRDEIARTFESVLRRRGAELARGPRGALLRAPAGLPSLGAIDSFRVISKIDASEFATVTTRLRYFGRNILVWVDTTAIPDLRDGQLQALSRLFDEELYPLNESAFGEASDVDGNGRVHVVLTPIVNQLTLAGQCTLSGFVGGFFSPHDLFPTTPNANGGEVFYGFVPDSAGTWGCPHSAGEFSRVIRTAFVHELQHVISYQQHVFRRGGEEEAIWLNEGMSHMAEELAAKYYERRFPFPSGRSVPGQVFPDSSQNFIVFNLINAYLFLRQPYFTSVTHFIEAGTIEERGASWLFLRWLADQYGEDILRRLVHTSLTGKANVADKTGEPFAQLLGQFMIATYADSIPGVARSAVPPRFRFHSRNLRELFQRLNTTAGFAPFPIETLAIPYDGKVSGPLRVGGAVMLTVAIPADKPHTRLSFSPMGGGPWPGTLAPHVSIFRLK
jgi:hypothetical protein